MRRFVIVQTSKALAASVTFRLRPFPLGPGFPFRVQAIELE